MKVRRSFPPWVVSNATLLRRTTIPLKPAPASTDFSLPPLENVQLDSPEKRTGKPSPLTRDTFINSVRKSWDVLAVAEQGPTKGAAYLPVMPMYTSEIISDQELESMWHYLRTLTDPAESGPAKVIVKRQKAAAVKSLLEIPNEVLVTTRARVFRAPLRGSSARALHVGLPNGMNYTFDPTPSLGAKYLGRRISQPFRGA